MLIPILKHLSSVNDVQEEIKSYVAQKQNIQQVTEAFSAREQNIAQEENNKGEEVELMQCESLYRRQKIKNESEFAFEQRGFIFLVQ